MDIGKTKAMVMDLEGIEPEIGLQVSAFADAQDAAPWLRPYLASALRRGLIEEEGRGAGGQSGGVPASHPVAYQHVEIPVVAFEGADRVAVPAAGALGAVFSVYHGVASSALGIHIEPVVVYRHLGIGQRSADGVQTYYETVKKPLDDGKLVEIEKALTQKEYLKRLSDADPAKRTLHKTRYHLTCQGHYYEIDLFPFWSDRALCEIQVSDETVPVALPPELTVLREVTHDPAYSNAALAEAVPDY